MVKFIVQKDINKINISKPFACEMHVDKLKLHVHGNSAIANMIRRVAICEVPVRSLEVDVEDIDCTEPYVLHEELQIRIRSLKLMQDVPVGKVWNVTLMGPGMKYAKDLGIPVSDLTTRVAMLGDGHHLKMKLRVVEGFGWQSAQWIITSAFTYKDLTYTSVDKVDKKGIFIPTMIDSAEIKENMRGKRIVMTESGKAEHPLDEIKKKIQEYDHVIKMVREWSSAETSASNEFALSFTTWGNITPDDYWKLIVGAICNGLEVAKKNHVVVHEETHVFIFEDMFASLAYAIIREIFNLNPQIKMIKPNHNKQNNQKGEIEIVSKDAKKLYLQAIENILNFIN